MCVEGGEGECVRKVRVRVWVRVRVYVWARVGMKLVKVVSHAHVALVSLIPCPWLQRVVQGELIKKHAKVSDW